MKVFVDVGNTRLKWAIEERNGFTLNGALNYRLTDFPNSLLRSWGALPEPRLVAISSVSDQHIVDQLMQLSRQLWPVTEVIIPRSSARLCGVVNAYAQPEKLGIDRWLNLLALHHHYPGPSCVLDCGTAITLDFLDETGRHLGGMICPGLRLMKDALSRGTSSLPFNMMDYQFGLADNTEAAIFSGTLSAVVGMLEHTLSTQRKQRVVVLTGGDAKMIAQFLPFRTLIEADLVLKGLSVYCGMFVHE